MNIVFFGTPNFVLPVLQILQEKYSVVGVVTTPDEKTGRKQILTPTPIKIYAMNNNIPVFTPNTLKELGNIDFGNSIDLFVVAAYGKIIPDKVINLPKYGSINIHPSRLPEYRGPSPIQSTILSGETETAVTIIKMDADVDHGPILDSESITIVSSDTFLSVAEKAFRQGAAMLPTIIDKIVNQKLEPIVQDHTKATFTSHIQKEDGYFDINNPPSPKQLDRMIRAYYPWPTAWTKINYGPQQTEKIIKFLPEQFIQVEGGKPMSMKDFLNGYPALRSVITPLYNNN